MKRRERMACYGIAGVRPRAGCPRDIGDLSTSLKMTTNTLARLRRAARGGRPNVDGDWFRLSGSSRRGSAGSCDAGEGRVIRP
jgi:hypothetical protein